MITNIKESLNKNITILEKKSFQFITLKILKKLIPQKIISFRQDFIKMKNIRKDLKLNWFINNTGDNCYIRGILKKR